MHYNGLSKLRYFDFNNFSSMNIHQHRLVEMKKETVEKFRKLQEDKKNGGTRFK